MLLAPAAALAPLSTWFYLVNSTVTSPYLDEVFHVRQAQLYCAGNFHDWDPKITTPPGLYLVSYFFSAMSCLKARLGLSPNPTEQECNLCNLGDLRLANLAGMVVLVAFMTGTYKLRNPRAQREGLIMCQHSAVNMILFPPLFFFSALYYTDIWSTLSVIICYREMVHPQQNDSSTVARFITILSSGLISLMFRQTNIFWVAVFPAAVTLVQHVDRGHEAVRVSMQRGVDGFGDSLYSVAKTAWKMQVVYDVPVGKAGYEDYIKCIISITASSVKAASNPQPLSTLLTALAPYLALLAAFAAFILWNGSVVLGDKGNHTATLHLPQMLYLWPFTAFFSLPLLLPTLLALLNPTNKSTTRKRLPRIIPTLLLLTLTLTIVHTNTIIHPFTLADNRHYIFYIFRLLLNPRWVRYAVTPLYLLLAYTCLQALGTTPQSPPNTTFTETSTQEKQPPDPLQDRQKQSVLPDTEHPARTSFTIIWLATSALQLVTAPLVEPRYFILPWLFWRMHLPLHFPPPPAGTSGESSAESPAKDPQMDAGDGGVSSERASTTISQAPRQWRYYDYRLWLETLWLLAVNAGTGYVFLKRGFEWPQEPGVAQRFMW